jgi:hypothetical protein
MKTIGSILKFIGGCFLLLVLWAIFRASSHTDSYAVAPLPVSFPVDKEIRENPLTASLTPAETNFSWNGWGIQVNRLQFADIVAQSHWRGAKTANSEAVFVVRLDCEK